MLRIQSGRLEGRIFYSPLGSLWVIPVALRTEDPFVPYERSEQVVEEMPTTDNEIHLYEGARQGS